MFSIFLAETLRQQPIKGLSRLYGTAGRQLFLHHLQNQCIYPRLLFIHCRIFLSDITDRTETDLFSPIQNPLYVHTPKSGNCQALTTRHYSEARTDAASSPLAVSIFGFACAAYQRTPPRKPSIFLARRKNPRFPNRKPAVSHPEFPDGNQLGHVNSIKNRAFTSANLSFPIIVVESAGRVGKVDVVARGKSIKNFFPDLCSAVATLARVTQVTHRQ
jgi:hypothetical protein